MAQRLVRAKRKIRHAGIPYRVPSADDLPERLGGVLAVLMLVHNEGYLASSGDRLLRLDLQEEAIRLARLVVELLPDAGRGPRPARAAAPAARAVGGARRRRRRARAARRAGPFALEHRRGRRGTGAARGAGTGHRGRARTGCRPRSRRCTLGRARPTTPTGRAIIAWYDALLAASPSPVVELNRAVAHGLAGDTELALAELDRLEASAQLGDYHLLPAAQADLLRRSGRPAEAAGRYRRAIELAPTGPERRFLERRLAALSAG